ncbi:MAG: hypothetical protein ACHQ16_03400 [Candidatus Lutacidiplasmatales archaeon]
MGTRRSGRLLALVVVGWVAVCLLLSSAMLVRAYSRHGANDCQCPPGNVCHCPAAFVEPPSREEQLALALLLGGLTLLVCGFGVTFVLVVLKLHRRRAGSGSPRR